MMPRIPLVILTLWLVALLAPAPAQSGQEIPGSGRNALRRLPGISKNSAPAIERLPRIERAPGRNALRRRAAAAPSSGEASKSLWLSIAGDPVKGDKGSRLALLDFTDYQ